jgi:hypothetical protein
VNNQLPLRTPQERLQFCDTYFQAVGADTTYEAEFYREYRLPRDVDKELTDRPFYWMWVEKTNQDVPPSTLRLAFHPSVVDRENARLKAIAFESIEYQNLPDIQKRYFKPPTAELLTLGSFRLDKLFTSVDKRGAFACVAPAKRLPNTRFAPWLMVNALVSNRCDSVEQELVSIGVCLVTGQVVERFYDIVKNIEMTDIHPDALLQNRRLSIPEGLEKVRSHLEHIILRRPTDWAYDAALRLEQELRQIGTYYNSILPDIPDAERPVVEAERDRKESELIRRAAPRVEVEYRQIALIALVDKAQTEPS